MMLSRRGFLVGSLALAVAGCKGTEEGANERLALLFDGLEEFQSDGTTRALDPFGMGDHPVVYFGAAREVYDGCSADIPMLQRVLTEIETDRAFVPVLVIPLPSSKDPDSKFLDEFRELQAAIPSARVLTHSDPSFLKSLAIRNGAAYQLDEGGYVEGHSRKLHVYQPDASQLLFNEDFAGRSKRVDVETFSIAIYSGRFEGAIVENCHVDRQLRTTLDFECL